MNGTCDTCIRGPKPLQARNATWRVVLDDVGEDGEVRSMVIAEVCDEHRKLAGMFGERLEPIGGT